MGDNWQHKQEREPPAAPAEDYEGSPSAVLGGKLGALLKIAESGGQGGQDPLAEADATTAGEPDLAESSEAPGEGAVVALLSALRRDIDSLRQENEQFKARLAMESSAPADSGAFSAGDAQDLRKLLAVLRADIESLRHENDYIRSQAFSVRSSTTVLQSAEHDLHAMLSELRADILALKSENDTLRREHSIGVVRHAVMPAQDEVVRLFGELKADIVALKHENESLRLGTLAARDGERLGLSGGAYRFEGMDWGALLRPLAMVALALGAAGGGYYLALSRVPQPVPGAILTEAAPPAVLTLPAAPAVPKPVAAPVEPAKPVDVTRTESPAPGAGSVDGSVEAAMLARAEQLIVGRDLGAARMMLVYLARKGSAEATRKLAETYDPGLLDARRIDGVANGDLDRARRLYAAALRMGDAAAGERLKELQLGQ